MDSAFTVLETPAPAFSEARAASTLDTYFGIRGRLKPLVSERDQNFMVTTADDEKFVMKIANSAEDPEVTDFQNGALLHVARTDREFPVPRLQRALNGEWSVTVPADDGRGHLVRVLAWLDGTPLRFVESTQEIARPLGTCLGRLDLALQGYRHNRSDYELLWDVKRAGSLAGLLQYVGDKNLRVACASRLEFFVKFVEPQLPRLRQQVIYNDLNPSNVLVDPQNPAIVTGVIDFGDMVRSPLVVDAAVAAAYLCTDGDDPFAHVLVFLKAYTQVLKLEPAEIDMLFELILTRHVLTVLITNWRAAKYPGNREYILRNEGKARAVLLGAADKASDNSKLRIQLACN